MVAEPESSPEASSESVPASVIARTDRSRWNWLLLIPIVVPLLTVLYNHDAPRIFGFPVFYWLQFSFIALGVATTTVVYRMTRK